VFKGPNFDAPRICEFTIEVHPRQCGALQRDVPTGDPAGVAGPDRSGQQRGRGAGRSRPPGPDRPRPGNRAADGDGPQPRSEPGGASDVLSRGYACRAAVVQSQDMGRKNQQGIEIYAFVLTVIVEGKAPYQIQVGTQCHRRRSPCFQRVERPGQGPRGQRQRGRYRLGGRVSGVREEIGVAPRRAPTCRGWGPRLRFGIRDGRARCGGARRQANRR
jgi:hypothetical protein